MARNAKRKRYRGIVLVVLVLWVGFHFAKNAVDNHRLRRQISDLETHLHVLQLRGGKSWKKKSNSGAPPRNTLNGWPGRNWALSSRGGK